MKQLILNTISDACADLLYYHRKEDDDLPVSAIEQAIINGEITIDEILAEFRTNLENSVNAHK